MRTGLAVSLVAHSALIAVGLIGLAHVQPLDPQEIEAISVDLVPIEEIASIRTGSEQSEVIETPAPSVVDTETPPEVAVRTGTTQEDQPRPDEFTNPTPAPTVNTAPEPVSRREPEPEPTPEPQAQPEPTPEPQPEPDPQPNPEPVLAAEPTDAAPAEVAPQPVIRTASLDQKRAEFKKKQEEKAKAEAAAKQAREADRVADIINSEKSRGATTGSGGQQSAGRPTGQAARLTQSELGALIAQMQRCWNPSYQDRADGVVIRLMVAMNRNGAVSGTPRVLTDTSGNASLGLAARSAARKVANCGPFNLPADKYDHWREIDVTLDARNAN
jgi:outer membrane biosynthesis protein TonB